MENMKNNIFGKALDTATKYGKIAEKEVSDQVGFIQKNEEKKNLLESLLDENTKKILNNGMDKLNSGMDNFTNANNIAGDSVKSLTDTISSNNLLPKNLTKQIPGAGALSKAMDLGSGISDATDDIEKGINKAKELVSNIDGNCAQNAYGHIIHENENDITKTVNKFVNDIFTVDSSGNSIINREDIEKATKEIFFNQLRRSIWEDYHIKHVLVYSIFKKTDNTDKVITSPDFTTLGPLLENAFNGFSNKGATENNINAIFNKFMTNLNTYVNKKAIKGGKRKIKKGGTNLPIENDTQKLAMKQKIEKWYSPDEGDEKINSDILYIITQAIQNALNEKEARKEIYKNITKVFENQITKMFDPNFGSDLSLKFYILYNLLLNDEILISTFKRCIKTTLLENIKRNQSSPPENQASPPEIDSTFILEHFSQQIKIVLFENPTRDPLKDVVNTMQSENTYKPPDPEEEKNQKVYTRPPETVGGRKRRSSQKTKKNKRTKKNVKKRTIKHKK